MKLSNFEIGTVLAQVLNHETHSISFDSLWEKHHNTHLKINIKKQAAIIVIAILILFAVGTVTFAGVIRNVDKTDYPFVNDARVIGKWQSVDFVYNMDDFIPGQKYWKSSLYLSDLVFIKQGKTLSIVDNGNLAYSSLTWTKNKVLNVHEKTASQYLIKDLEGNQYMFLEWKSGDYVFSNIKPGYYVLKKVDNNDYSNYQVHPVKEDNINYPFTDDSNMKGKWVYADFVKDIAEFSPDVKSWRGDTYLTEINIYDNGNLILNTTSGEVSRPSIVWTKGMIINKDAKTASKCEIKKIKGNTYLFYEWKNGDYIYRGIAPYYYVLKKVD